MSVKAMFVCSGKEKDDYGTMLMLFVPHGVSGVDVIQGGSLSINIASGSPAADYFEIGKPYYLMFEKAD